MDAFGVMFEEYEVVELAEFFEALKVQSPPPPDHLAAKLMQAVIDKATEITG